MEVTMKFQIGNEVSVKSYPVENLKGKVSIKNVFSALKKMRQDVDSVLNKYVEEEKQRSVNENSEGVAGDFGIGENDDDEDGDDDGSASDKVSDEEKKQCQPDKKKQKMKE